MSRVVPATWFYYGDEYYFYFMGGHARASPKGGRSCSLGTLNYLIVSHLAFRLTKCKKRAWQAVPDHPTQDAVIPEGYGATER